MPEKSGCHFAPANTPGEAQLRCARAISAGRSRSAHGIMVRLDVGGGPARGRARAAVPGGNGKGAGRAKPGSA
jgi:hypothetical protein